MSILDEIFANKRREVAEQKTRLSASALAAQAAQTPQPPEFLPHPSPLPKGEGIDAGNPSPLGRGGRGEGNPSPLGRGGRGEGNPSPLGRGDRGEGNPSPFGAGRGEGKSEGFTIKHRFPPELLERIRELRQKSTTAEEFLWQILRNRHIHQAKFRRQHPMDGYFLDFYCHEARLVIELDGGVHTKATQIQHDKKRTQHLESKGLKVIRFWNNEVFQATESVLNQIWLELDERLPLPHPSPLPKGEGIYAGNPSPYGRGGRGERTPSPYGRGAGGEGNPSPYGRGAGGEGNPHLIAEVKHRSPSKGILIANFNPLALARLYVQNGAAAISVLTDETYFGGSLDHLRAIANLQTGIPLLRKDFIFDDYQILQARAAGASAILLIVAMLPPQQLRDLLQTTAALGLRALVETHTAEEIETALAAGAPIIGVNNRNLHTFTTDLQTCIRLRPLVPPEIPYVAESGIHTPADVAQLRAANIHAMLIGESIVTAPDPAAHIHSLLA